MSAVCVLTPIIVSQWPAIMTAVVGAASSLGWTVMSSQEETVKKRVRSAAQTVEITMENSEVIQEALGSEEKMTIEKGGVQITFSRGSQGNCQICVTGENFSKSKLKEIGEEVSGRVVQQFAYHKLMTELKDRGYSIVEESVNQDQSIQVRVRST
ncbi:MAG: DUF1257 domain-containing protein [Planctomycetota bacterium]